MIFDMTKRTQHLRRTAWYRPPDWPDYSQLSTSEFVKRQDLTSSYHYCNCYFTCHTKHPTVHTFSVGSGYLYSATLGHFEAGNFVIDKDIKNSLPYTFDSEDPEYACVHIEGYGYGIYHHLRITGPVLEAYGYLDFNRIFNTDNAIIDTTTLEAMTLWGEMSLGGMNASIFLNNLKYIDLSHASSMVINGRFYETMAFKDFRGLTVCKLPDGIRKTVGETWFPYAMFQNCFLLGDINLKNMDYTGFTTFKNNFNSCRCLVSINLDGVDLSSVTSMAGAFTACYALENIYLSDAILPSVSFSLADSSKLTNESLVAIANALPIVSSTLTLHATPKAACTTIIGTVTDGVFVQDENGTVTLTEFITTTKGWTLA